MPTLVPELDPVRLQQMSVVTSHALARYKVKFCADKVDTMLVQSLRLWDKLEKDLINFSRKLHDWFGWHFPEMEKIVTDKLDYARVIKLMGIPLRQKGEIQGFRTAAANTDFSNVLPEEEAAAVRSASRVSIGTEISKSDLDKIILLADQVIAFHTFHYQLHKYLTRRMHSLAPNLLNCVGELIAARMLAKAGGLTRMAKFPVSTIQLLGAEKSLSHALLSDEPTPRYGYIYHSSIVQSAPSTSRGQVARGLAAKAALAVRCDAFQNTDSNGIEDAATDGETADEKEDVEMKSQEVVEEDVRSNEEHIELGSPKVVNESMPLEKKTTKKKTTQKKTTKKKNRDILSNEDDNFDAASILDKLTIHEEHEHPVGEKSTAMKKRPREGSGDSSREEVEQ